MVVAVVLVGAVQAPVDQEVDVVVVTDRGVPAVGPVDVLVILVDVVLVMGHGRDRRPTVRGEASRRGLQGWTPSPDTNRQARPVVVISRDAFNTAGWGLCLCAPWSTRDCGSPLHVEASPPEGCLRARSFALVDQIRSLDRSRLIERWGC